MSCCKPSFNASFSNPLGIFLSSLTITSAKTSSSDFSFSSSTLIVFMYSTAVFLKTVGPTSLSFVSSWILGGFAAAISSVSLPSAAFPTLKLENVYRGVM